MEMDEMHRKILDNHRVYLLKNLEPMKLLPYLYTVLDEADRQEIEQEPTRERKVVKLLDMLPKRGPDAFDAFIKALEEKQEFIARFLKPETDMLPKRRPDAFDAFIKALEEKQENIARCLKKETDKPCSHCVKLEEDLNKIRRAKKKLEEDVLKMNNEIKEFSEYSKQENQKVRQDLENLKKDLQESNERVTKETEDQVQEITTLQKENQELRDETEQKRCKINELNAQLTKKNEALRKTREELEDEKENGKKLKGNWKRCAREKKKAMEENEELNKKLNKQDECYSHCEKLKEELNLIKTEKENLEKEVGELKNSIKEMSEDYQRAFQTPLQKERESHSRCEELQRTLNVITGERDSMREQKQNLDKEVLNLNNRIKEISEDYQRTKKELQQILKEERENVSRELVAANEQRKEEKNVLQGKNEELKDQIKRQTSEVQTKTVQPTREKRYIEKNQKEGQPRQKWALNHNKEKRGVVYAFATDFGKRTWESGSSTRIIATRSSDHKGFAKDLLEKGRGAVSGTKDEENSWWCVELPAKYVLNLTHYTLSRSRNDQESYILNWRLEGSLDGYAWAILKEHKDDSKLKAHPYSHTWSVDGELGAFRYFRIYQTGKNSSGKYNIYLSGIELYGVLMMRS